MRILLLSNPRSGGARRRRLAARALDRLRAQGASVEAPCPRSADETRALAAEAGGRYDAVVASGGDGTVSAVVNGLARCDRSSRPPLAIFPAGRGNDFAAHVGLSRFDDTLRALAAGTTRSVDIGRSGEAYFVSVAGTGFDARAARRALTTPLLSGSLLYTYAALRTLVGFEPIPARVRYEGGSFEGAITFVAVGNSSRYGGGMKITPRADVSDGLLDLCLVQAISKTTLLRVFPSVFAGGHLTHPSVGYHRSTFVEVETDVACEVFADGEPIGTTPARIEIVPAALEIFVAS